MSFSAVRSGEQYDGARRVERYVSHESSSTTNGTNLSPRKEFAARVESISMSHPDWSEDSVQNDRRRMVDNRLLAYRQDLAEWFQDLFKANITEASFIEDIETGVLLCRLALLVDQAESDQGLPITHRSAIRFNKKAQRGDFVARDNVACFIAWARSLGVEAAVLFETDDLVARKNEKHVLYCLMEIGRVQRGLPPPKLVQIERLLDAGQVSLHTREDEQQQAIAIRDSINRLRLSGSIRVERVDPGLYTINGQGPYHVVLLRQFLMIRVGRHWDTFDNFLSSFGAGGSRSISQAPSVFGGEGSVADSASVSPYQRRGEEVTPRMISRAGSQMSLARSASQQQMFAQQTLASSSRGSQQQLLSPRGSSHLLGSSPMQQLSSPRGSGHQLLSPRGSQVLSTSRNGTPLRDRGLSFDGGQTASLSEQEKIMIREQMEALFSQRIGDLEQELANARAELEMQGRRLSDHHSSLSEAERQAVILRTRAETASEVHSLKSVIQELEARLRRSDESHSEADELRAELRAVRAEAEQKSRDMVPQIVYRRSQEDEDAINSLQTELQQLREEAELRNQEISDQARQIKAQEKALHDMQADHEAEKAAWLAKQQQQMDEHLRRLQEQMNARLRDLQQELEASQQALQAHRQSSDRSNEAQRAEIERLTGLNVSLTEQDEQRVVTIESLQKTIRELTLQIRAHEMRSNELDDVSKDLLSSRDLLARDKKALEARVAILEPELKNAESENSRLREELEALRAKYEAAHTEAQNMTARVHELEPQLAATSAKLSEREEKIIELEATLAALEKQLEDQINKNHLLTSDKELAAIEHERLVLAHTSEREALHLDLTSKHANEVEELKKALRELQAASDEQKARDAELIEQLRARIRELEAQLAALQERLAQLEAEQEEERRRGQAEREAAEQKLKEIEEARLAEEARLKREHDEQSRLRAEQAAAEQRAREEEEARRLAEAKRQADEAQAKLEQMQEAERQRLAELERQRLEAEEKARLAEEERLRQIELQKKKEEEERLRREKEEQEALLQAQREEEERINSAEMQKELRDLAPIMKDVADWINEALGLNPGVTSANLMESLASGELLCQLAAAIDDAEDNCRGAESEGRELDAEGFDTVAAAESEEGARSTRPSVNSRPTTKASPGARASAGAGAKKVPKKLGWNYTPPVGVSKLRDYIRGRALLPPNFTKGAVRGTDAARKNITNFLEWTKRLGLSNCMSVDDLAKVNRNPRRVLYGLMDVARRTRRFPLPTMVWLERRASYTYEADPADDVDKAVKDQLVDCICHPPLAVKRIAAGKYAFGAEGKPIMVKVVGKSVTVRVGGGWDSMKNFLMTHDPCRANPNLQEIATRYAALLAAHKKSATKKYSDSLGKSLGFLSTLQDPSQVV